MSVGVTLIFNGLANGALYFLMSAGLTLIFGLLRVINFAHGAFYLWGAYAGVFLYSELHNFLLAILGGVITGAALGLLTERGLMAKVYQDPTRQLLLTMGVLLVLTELLKIPFGRDPVGAITPSMLAKSWLLGHFVLVEYQVFTLGMGILVYVGLLLLLHRTRLGLVIRAGVANPDLVLARGVPIRRIFTSMFMLGAGLAGLAGALAGPYYGSVTPDMGMNMQLNAFIIVVLGGLGSLNGSVLGSLLIGVATAVVGYYAPSLAVLAAVLVMAMVLVVRPAGLFGEKEVA